MKIVQLTTDNRNQYGDYEAPVPYFGTAPTALLEGFAFLDDIEVHVISCASKRMTVPKKLAANIYFHQPYVPKLGWGRSFFAGCVYQTRKLIHSIRPDVVHGQGTERDCAMEAALSGFPNVLTLHGNMRVHAARPDNGNPRYYQMAAKLEEFCLRRTGGVVAISSYTRDLVSALAHRTWLLPNAVDSRFFSVTPAEQDIPRILFVGMINERKNPYALLNCCKNWLAANRCKLVIAGDGNPASDYYRKFMDEAKALPGVELLGFINRDQLAEEMGRSSLLVLPTLEDNCPMVVLEAMAAGLPVAASRVGGVPDLIEDEVDGLMFDPADPVDMGGKIRRLIEDSKLRERFAKAAKMKALEKFHPRAIAVEHVRLYRELLETNGR